MMRNMRSLQDAYQQDSSRKTGGTHSRCGDPTWLLPQREAAPEGCRPGNEPVVRRRPAPTNFMGVWESNQVPSSDPMVNSGERSSAHRSPPWTPGDSGEWGRQRPGSLSQIEGELAKIPVCEAGERTEKIKEKRF